LKIQQLLIIVFTGFLFLQVANADEADRIPDNETLKKIEKALKRIAVSSEKFAEMFEEYFEQNEMEKILAEMEEMEEMKHKKKRGGNKEGELKEKP